MQCARWPTSTHERARERISIAFCLAENNGPGDGIGRGYVPKHLKGEKHWTLNRMQVHSKQRGGGGDTFSSMRGLSNSSHTITFCFTVFTTLSLLSPTLTRMGSLSMSPASA